LKFPSVIPNSRTSRLPGSYAIDALVNLGTAVAAGAEEEGRGETRALSQAAMIKTTSPRAAMRIDLEAAIRRED
jgi:hypothetical protein